MFVDTHNGWSHGSFIILHRRAPTLWTYLLVQQGSRQNRRYFYSAELSEAGQKWYNFVLPGIAKKLF